MGERQLLTIDPETVRIVDNRRPWIISAKDRAGGEWAFHLLARDIIVLRQCDIEEPDFATKLELLQGNLGMVVDATKAQQALDIERARYPGREFCLGVAVSNDPKTGRIRYGNTDLGVWTRAPAVAVLGSEAQPELMGAGHA